MPRLYNCLFALSAATALSASEVNARNNDHDCPWVDVNNVRDGTTTAGCCVGGTVASVYLSVCDGWPICNGPTTTTTTSTPLSCATFISYANSNYDDELSSASSSVAASGTTFCTTLGVEGDSCHAASATATATGTTAEPASTASDAGSTATGTASGDSGILGPSGTDGGASLNSTATGARNGTASLSSATGSSGITTKVSSTQATAKSSTSSATTSASTAGANALGGGWGAWALGLAAAGPGVMAVVL